MRFHTHLNRKHESSFGLIIDFTQYFCSLSEKVGLVTTTTFNSNSVRKKKSTNAFDV